MLGWAQRPIRRTKAKTSRATKCPGVPLRCSLASSRAEEKGNLQPVAIICHSYLGIFSKRTRAHPCTDPLVAQSLPYSPNSWGESLEKCQGMAGTAQFSSPAHVLQSSADALSPQCPWLLSGGCLSCPDSLKSLKQSRPSSSDPAMASESEPQNLAFQDSLLLASSSHQGSRGVEHVPKGVEHFSPGNMTNPRCSDSTWRMAAGTWKDARKA